MNTDPDYFTSILNSDGGTTSGWYSFKPTAWTTAATGSIVTTATRITVTTSPASSYPIYFGPEKFTDEQRKIMQDAIAIEIAEGRAIRFVAPTGTKTKTYSWSWPAPLTGPISFELNEDGTVEDIIWNSS